MEEVEEGKIIILWFEAEFKDPLLIFYLYAEWSHYRQVSSRAILRPT